MGCEGYKVTFEMKDYDVHRDERLEFTERCFDFALAGGPLPGRHCSVLLLVRPGDLLLPDEEEPGTFCRHLDPKTSSKLHEKEAASFLSFFGEAAKAQLNNPGRVWKDKAPSAEVISARVKSIAAHIRDKLADFLREEAPGMGLLSAIAFAWSLGHLDAVHRSYDPLVVENPKLVGLKALRLELLDCVEKAALSRREASSVGRGVGTGIALGGEAEEAAAGSHSVGHGFKDGGEEEQEEEDQEGGGEEVGGLDEEEEDEESEDADEEAVPFAGEKVADKSGAKVADKSGGSGPKSGKKARGSGGSTTTRMASKAVMERLKAAERENKRLREEKLVAEKRLENQMVRMDTLHSSVSAAVHKLGAVADRVTAHEQTSGASLEGAVEAMKAVVEEACRNRNSIIEHMNDKWLPTVNALNLATGALNNRRHEDDVLLLRGVADALGEKIKTVVSAEVKAVMQSEAKAIAAAVSAKVAKELREVVVKAVTSATQQGLGAAGFSLLPNALASAMHGGRSTAEEHGPPPRHAGKRVADEKSLTGEQTSGIKRSRGPAAKRGSAVEPPAAPYVRIPGVNDLLKEGLGARPSADFRQRLAATTPPSVHDALPSGDQTHLVGGVVGGASVVGMPGGQPLPEASPANAHGAPPSGGTTQMAGELLHIAAVVGQQGGQAVARQHVQPSTGTGTARPTGDTVQLALAPAAVVGQQGGQAAAGQHPHPSTSTATAQDERPGARLADDLLRTAAVVRQQGGQAAAGPHPHPSMSSATAQEARPGAGLADDLLRSAAVVRLQGGQSAAGPHPHPSTSSATGQDARPGAGLADDLLRSAAVVRKQGGPSAAGQHPPPSTSTATAPDARPAAVRAQLADDLLRSAAVVGQQGGQPAAGQHPHPSTSPAGSARPGGTAALLADEPFRPMQRATGVLPSGVVEAATPMIVSASAPAPHRAGTAHGTPGGVETNVSLPNPPPPTTVTDAAASLPGQKAGMVGVEAIPAPAASPAVEGLINRKGTWEEYLKWLEDQSGPEVPPSAARNKAVDPGAETGNATAATAGASVTTTEEAALWGLMEEAGGMDPAILASIVMPDPEVEALKDKVEEAAPTAEARRDTPAASSAPAVGPSATGAKSLSG
ncbi:unnamed protein product [Closterium sp. Yama58-4]|nr:unnamed protein product [Closterium sp. Yama58-4]